MRRDDTDERPEPSLFELWMGMMPAEWDALDAASADEEASTGSDRS